MMCFDCFKSNKLRSLKYPPAIVHDETMGPQAVDLTEQGQIDK